MKLIGITGGIATGKSTVADLFADYGVKIIDVDSIAKKIVKPKKKAWRDIVREFGKKILNSDGTINRKKLGLIVFSDANAREKLNKITHLLILKSIKNDIEKYKKQKESFVIIDAALLGEFGEKKPLVDILIVVTADKKNQLERLIRRSKISQEEANQRISSQIAMANKLKKTDYIIDTSGSLKDTKQRVIEILEDILSKRQKTNGFQL